MMKRTCWTDWLVVVSLAVLMAPSFAAATSTGGVIRVRVGFREGTCTGALVDASVVLKPTGIEGRTDGEGIVEFTGVEPGTYVVHLASPCQSGSCWDMRDADTGQPIAGAVVTLNDAMSVSSADGTYSIRSRREELCSGLDYLFVFSAQASGYSTLREEFYRVPFDGPAQRTIDLAPIPESPSPSALAMDGAVSLRSGRIF